MNLGRWAPVVVLGVGLLAYAPVLDYSFFWEDPFDIGQVDPHTWLGLLAVPNSDSYYRPLTLVILKLLKFGQPIFQPHLYHGFVVAGHLVSCGLLHGLARFLFRDDWYALAAALIFCLYPPSFEAVARAISPHTWLAAAILAALWLYARGRLTRQRWPVFAALALITLAQLTHENGLLFPGFLIALEVWLVWQGRVKRFSPMALAFLLPAIAFALLWLSVPKPAGLSINLGLRSFEAMYLSQGLSFPVAGMLSQVGGWGLPPTWQALLAFLIAVTILLVISAREHWPRLLLAISWWAVAVSLVWLTRSFDYLSISPRLFYLGGVGAALAWAGVVNVKLAWPRSVIGRQAVPRLALAALLVLEAITLFRLVTLYRAGSHLMHQIVAAGTAAGAGSRVLFINVPDRFEYKAPLYPLGHWGMLLAPVSQDLADFVSFSSGVPIASHSLSDFPLLGGPLAASPYRVNTRGSDAHASTELYELTRWANVVFVTHYAPDGRLWLSEAGDIEPVEAARSYLADYAGVARLLRATASAQADGTIHLMLAWQALSPAQVHDTVFVHLFDADEQLAAQADGDSLSGLIPLAAWRPGDLIRDLRVISPEAALPPGAYQLRVGLYNRVSGERYPAQLADGTAWPEGAALAAKLLVSPP